MRVLRLASALIGLALLSACTRQPPVITPSPGNRITPQEIAGIRATNAYEVVEWLRPDWLRPRVDPTATGSLQQILVLFNGAQFGMLPSLRDLPLEAIGGIVFLPPTSAQRADLRVGSVIAVYSPGVPTDRVGLAEHLPRTPVIGVGLSLYPLALGTQERTASGEDGWTPLNDGPGSSMVVMGGLELGYAGGISMEALVTGSLGPYSDSY